jgi:predicted solute-binding protein
MLSVSCAFSRAASLNNFATKSVCANGTVKSINLSTNAPGVTRQVGI